MRKNGLKDVYVSADVHTRLKNESKQLNCSITELAEKIFSGKKHDIEEIINRKEAQLNDSFKELFHQVIRSVERNLTTITALPLSEKWPPQLRAELMGHLKNTLQRRLELMEANTNFHDEYNIEFHRSLLELNAKYSHVFSSDVTSKDRTLSFIEEEIILRYLFENKKEYSGVTINPIKFHKEQLFYLKLHEILKKKSPKIDNDFKNCRIVLTSLTDLESHVKLRNPSDKIGMMKVMENLFYLQLFVNWHHSNNVKLLYVPLEKSKVIFKDKYKSPHLWDMKLGIFFNHNVIQFGEEFQDDKTMQMKREIQISEKDSESYRSALRFYEELYNHEEKLDFGEFLREKVTAYRDLVPSIESLIIGQKYRI